MARIVDDDTVYRGKFCRTGEWKMACEQVRQAIKTSLVWPLDSNRLTLRRRAPGARSGGPNGTVPLKENFRQAMLACDGWTKERLRCEMSVFGQQWVKEHKFTRRSRCQGVGNIDFLSPGRLALPVGVEMELDNSASPHRAIMKLSMAMEAGFIGGGILIVPTPACARHLNARVAHAGEIKPYYSRIRRLVPIGCAFRVISFEQHATNNRIDPVPKQKTR